MFGKIGTQELLVIFAIVLVVFGPKQLPKLGKTFGKTIKGFKDGIDAGNEEDSNREEEN
jgi:sec-independent protein translocase protein TatA